MKRTLWAGIVTIGAGLFLAGCTGATPTPTDTSSLTGVASAGQTKFSSSCSACHTAALIKGAAGSITTNLGSINVVMSGISLTAQDVADLKAFLATQ